MFVRFVVLAAAFSQLIACVPIPEVKFHETLKFDYAPPSQEPVNYADLMCCYDCTV